MDQLKTDEVWVPVPDARFASKYEVSSLGRVRNIRSGRILTPMRTGDSRAGSQRSKVRFSTSPRVDWDIAHLVLCAFVNVRPDGGVAMHANDDSTDNRLVNLSWGTHRANTRDAFFKIRSPIQKVTPAQAEEIARRRANGEKGAALAKEYGISMQRVCDIYKGRVACLGSK